MNNMDFIFKKSEIIGYSGNETKVVFPSKNADGTEIYCVSKTKQSLTGVYEGIQEAIFDEGIRFVDRRAFEGNSTLERVVFPPSFKWAKDYAFSGCDNLTEVVAYGQCFFDNNTFSKCRNLKHIWLFHPNSLITTKSLKNNEAYVIHVPANSICINEFDKDKIDIIPDEMMDSFVESYYKGKVAVDAFFLSEKHYLAGDILQLEDEKSTQSVLFTGCTGCVSDLLRIQVVDNGDKSLLLEAWNIEKQLEWYKIKLSSIDQYREVSLAGLSKYAKCTVKKDSYQFRDGETELVTEVTVTII